MIEARAKRMNHSNTVYTLWTLTAYDQIIEIIQKWPNGMKNLIEKHTFSRIHRKLNGSRKKNKLQLYSNSQMNVQKETTEWITNNTVINVFFFLKCASLSLSLSWIRVWARFLWANIWLFNMWWYVICFAPYTKIRTDIIVGHLKSE